MFRRWWHYPVFGLLALGGVAAGMVALAAILVYPNLPSLDALTDYRPKIPLRVYTADGALIGEFGEQRRALVKIENVPLLMKKAILAAEDERFYQHGGVDYLGVVRAALSNVIAGGAKEGASTITMQVARNFFLSREKTLSRKFSEALLALKIEHSLSKNRILDLYINQIYLGQRAYGFAAAAQTYFGKPLNKLSLAEMAVLAGLPKAPSSDNPVTSLKRATERQHYVLRRMHVLGDISDAQYQQALHQRLRVRLHQPTFPVSASYVAEMVRQYMYGRYHEAAYTSGFRVYTTLHKKDQQAADQALWKGVQSYEHRHGYRGPEGFIALPAGNSHLDKTLEDALQDVNTIHGLVPGVVLAKDRKGLKVYLKVGKTVWISGPGLVFARGAPDDRTPKRRRIRRGSLIRVTKAGNGGWQIAQLPKVEAAFVSLDPENGAIRALVGGFDFNRNQFNHVTMAWRQPGSSFKPFIYSAALEKGFTAATIVNDAPILIEPAETGGKLWAPKDYEGNYAGPIRFRTALIDSKNLASIRILQAIGIPYALSYITRFGFDPTKQPPYLTMALGAGTVTPLQMAAAYAVFANGGYRVKPYYIQRIVDARSDVIAQADPAVAGKDAKRVISARNAFIMTSIMQGVVSHGTAQRAMQLGRHDLAGKTGTTNKQVDAWFAGFQPPNVVAVAWVGFDQPHPLGSHETGARAALPIWMDYMAKVLKGVPETALVVPPGVVAVKINPQTGLREPQGQSGMTEFFYQGNVPPVQGAVAGGTGAAKPSEEVKEQLF